MVDFRKWFPALAVGAIVVGSAVTASAQTPPNAAPLQCVANAGTTPLIRSEGISELVGDVVLNCTGGTPTAVGQTVPQVNIQIFLNTNVTSRLVATPDLTEALILIDDPARANLNPCVAALASNCAVAGVNAAGTGAGQTSVNFRNAAPGGAVYNVFQGHTVPNSPNSIAWFGVPIDPPGSNGTRTIRITNVRADASFLSGQTPTNTFIPTQVTEFISITPPQSLPLNNPQQTVAFLSPGLAFTLTGATANFGQCFPANPGASGGSAFNQTTTAVPNGVSLLANFTEGFASSFKVRNVAQYGTNNADVSAPPVAQDTPGGICATCIGGQYFTETGYYAPSLTTTNGLNKAGLADTGTRLLLRFNAVPAGLTVLVGLYEAGTNASTSRVRLISTDASGAGTFTAVASSGGSSNLAAVSISGGSGMAVYEVMADNPLSVETISIPVVVSFSPGTSNGTPTPALGTATITGELAPISTDHTASATAPIPRFVDNPHTSNAFTINPCTTNLLFPFITNQAGYDTGIALSNTSTDPFGTQPQNGTCTLNYYPATATGAPSSGHQDTPTINSGTVYAFTLSQGNPGAPSATPAVPALAATAGFQGYMIAQCRFQYAHGFAFITTAGQGGQAQGYLALVLDAPLPSRTAKVNNGSETLGQ